MLIRLFVSVLALIVCCVGVSFAEDSEYLNTIAWDAEYDVVVVGFGGAGASASIEAANAGANVLLLEKAPQGGEGGNTKYAGQGVMSILPEDVDAVVGYLKTLRGKMNTPSDTMIETYVNKNTETAAWIESIGGKNLVNMIFQEYAYAGGEKVNMVVIDGEVFTGKFWDVLHSAVLANEQIEVWYESRGIQLIQDPATKIIHGVTVDNNGTKLNVRAINGVVLATGGFENNMQMIQDYLQLPYAYSKGAHYNTGDGIKMAMEVGADLWHMSNAAGPDLNVLNPDAGISFGYAIQGKKGLTSYGFSVKDVIYVGADGTRFMDESEPLKHGFTDFHGFWMHAPTAIPAYAIFDEDTRLMGPIYPSWSENNEAEIEKGIIVKADTLAELAEKMGLPADALVAQVEAYNQYCADGVDPVWGRSAEYLTPIDNGPFYAMELVPTLTNTQGGPVRNEKAEVIDVHGNPIPHLYSAGEMGSMFSDIYNGTGNLGECVTFGRIAGENAAAAKSDVTVASVMEGREAKTATWTSASDIAVADNERIGVGSGIGGDITVKVTLDGDKIAAIEILSHNETAGLSDAAVEQMPKRIVDAQSTEVETVSGATVTSRGIIDAVQDAMK